MNDQMVKEAVARIDAYSKDQMRMLAKSFGLELLPKVTESRNKREGKYFGCFHGKHRRSVCKNAKQYGLGLWAFCPRDNLSSTHFSEIDFS